MSHSTANTYHTDISHAAFLLPSMLHLSATTEILCSIITFYFNLRIFLKFLTIWFSMVVDNTYPASQIQTESIFYMVSSLLEHN